VVVTVVLEMDDRRMMNAFYGGTYTNSQLTVTIYKSHVERIKKGHPTNASERLHIRKSVHIYGYCRVQA
jgi:hypothetical protein